MQPETSSVAPSYRRPCAETSHRPCGFRRAEHPARARQGQNPQGRWREYRATEVEVLPPLLARAIPARPTSRHPRFHGLKAAVLALQLLQRSPCLASARASGYDAAIGEGIPPRTAARLMMPTHAE